MCFAEEGVLAAAVCAGAASRRQRTAELRSAFLFASAPKCFTRPLLLLAGRGGSRTTCASPWCGGISTGGGSDLARPSLTAKD